MIEVADGRKIAAEILTELKQQVQSLDFRPRLGVFLVGDNPASVSYVRIKGKKAREIGIEFELKKYGVDIEPGVIVRDIEKLAAEKNVCGILVQLPLPPGFDRERILGAIPPELDVDCLTPANKQKLAVGGEIALVPPAAAAALKILEYYGVDLRDKKIVLVGAGDLIGKPLAHLLRRRSLDYQVVDINTKNPEEIISKADVIVSGVGKTGLITGEKIKPGAVIIDAGTTGSEEGKIRGDVDFDSVSGKAKLVSPVPGGVGPVTVAMLLANVLRSAGIDRKSNRH